MNDAVLKYKMLYNISIGFIKYDKLMIKHKH